MVNLPPQTIAEAIIEYLIKNEVNTFFIVTGENISPMVDYIEKRKEIKYYCFQHEQSAAMAAESYYRSSQGKVGAVLSMGGPGAQNLLNGICGCYYESVPCVFITGQVDTYESLDSVQTTPRQVGPQESPISKSFKYFTKYSTKLTTPRMVSEQLHLAFSAMLSNRKGPILLEVPLNIQGSNKSKFMFKHPVISNSSQLEISEELNFLRKYLKKSKRPLFLLGNGIKLSHSEDMALEMVNSIKIPFVTSWGGFDIISHDHPLFIGDIGVYGSRSGNFAIQNCDLLISIGSRLDTQQTGKDLSKFSRESYKVVVDIDPNELYKNRGLDIDMVIEGDAKLFMRQLTDVITPLDQISEWLNYVNKLKSSKENRPLNEKVLSPYKFLEELNLKLPDNSTVIPDEGNHLFWSMQSLKPNNTQKVYSNFGNASTGYALPASIGASIVNSNPIICISGDGSFQANIQELQTIKNYNLPIKIFIINNKGYGSIKQFQDSYFNSRYTATDGDDYSSPDFVKIAEAYGIKALRATKKNYKKVINLAMQEKGCILVDVIIDKNQNVTPKLEPGYALEDMSPYLTAKQIHSNMIIDMIHRDINHYQGWKKIEE